MENSTRCPIRTTRMSGMTARSKVSTEIDNSLAASSFETRIGSCSRTTRYLRAALRLPALVAWSPRRRAALRLELPAVAWRDQWAIRRSRDRHILCLALDAEEVCSLEDGGGASAAGPGERVEYETTLRRQ